MEYSIKDFVSSNPTLSRSSHVVLIKKSFIYKYRNFLTCAKLNYYLRIKNFKIICFLVAKLKFIQEKILEYLIVRKTYARIFS